MSDEDMKELAKQMSELVLEIRKERVLLERIANPFFFGVFQEDHLYSQPLTEMKRQFEAARSDKRPEQGYLFAVNLTFYGVGGKHCSGRLQIDGASIEFDEIENMHRAGLTEPLSVGWYVSSWDTAKHIYGVAWTTNYPIPYQDLFRLYIDNANARTAAGTNNVTFNMTTTRFVKSIAKEVLGQRKGELKQ